MYARPSEKMASKILPLTKMHDLASFYNDSIGPSAKQTQQKSIRKQSQCVSLPRLEKRLSQGSQSPFSNSLALQSSLHVDLANISKSQQQSRDKQQSFAPKTSDSSEMANSSITTTQNKNTWMPSHCPSKSRRKMKKMDTITQIALGDVKLCPVRAAAAIVKQIQSYPGSLDDLPVLSVMINDCVTHVTSQNVTDALRNAVVAIREHKLGIKKENIDTHLIGLGVAMAMYLGECAVYTIMLIVRWSSNAFFQYIWKQVMEFSQNVARKMLTYQNFCHIPDIHRQIPLNDPQQCNNSNNAKTRRNVGGNMLCQACLPAFFSVFIRQHLNQSKCLVFFMVEAQKYTDYQSGIGGGEELDIVTPISNPSLRSYLICMLPMEPRQVRSVWFQNLFVMWRLMQGEVMKDLICGAAWIRTRNCGRPRDLQPERKFS
jgi:hypothetical protein